MWQGTSPSESAHWMKPLKGCIFFFLTAKDYCKVIFPYEAQNDDELTIKEGDIVTLINKVNKDSLLLSKL